MSKSIELPVGFLQVVFGFFAYCDIPADSKLLFDAVLSRQGGMHDLVGSFLPAQLTLVAYRTMFENFVHWAPGTGALFVVQNLVAGISDTVTKNLRHGSIHECQDVFFVGDISHVIHVVEDSAETPFTLFEFVCTFSDSGFQCRRLLA